MAEAVARGCAPIVELYPGVPESIRAGTGSASWRPARGAELERAQALLPLSGSVDPRTSGPVPAR